jgi:hypothetical protein
VNDCFGANAAVSETQDDFRCVKLPLTVELTGSKNGAFGNPLDVLVMCLL